MKTGIEFIAQERQEQIEKHGWTLDHDTLVNNDGELFQAALAILNIDYSSWPSSWDFSVYIHIANKPVVEKWAIACALIAAEIDRLQSMDKK
jgi:hypothetical protein